MTTKIKSGAITAVLVALIIVLLTSFAYTFNPEEYKKENPPKDPPEGFEVSLGHSRNAMGDNAEASAAQTSPSTKSNPPEKVVTQNTHRTASVPTSPEHTPQATPKQEVVPQEPAINQNALFSRNKVRKNGDGGKGVTQGTGTQGDPNGNSNSNNFNGTSGHGGNGGSYSLAGRTAVTLPKPEYNSNQQGTVVVRIWVDQNGKVTRAEYEPKGSNTQDGTLVSQAIAAARKARFNKDPKAQEEQRGTITYIFRI